MTPQEQPDSQAGDGLRAELAMLRWHDDKSGEEALFGGVYDTEHFERMYDFIEAYAERLATKRAIAELEGINMYHNSAWYDAIGKRIDELKAALAGKAKQ